MCDKCNCNKSSSGVFKTTMIVIGLALIALVGFLAWEQYKENKCLTEEPVEVSVQTPPSVDTAVQWFIQDVQSKNREERYHQLSPTIVRAIFEKIGTLPSIDEVMTEYEANKAYYLSLQAAEAIGNVDMPGPDAKKIKSISTTVLLDSVVLPSDDLKRALPGNK